VPPRLTQPKKTGHVKGIYNALFFKKSSDGAVISKTNRPKHTNITMRLPVNSILQQELH